MTSLDVTDYNIEYEDTIEDWCICKQLVEIVNSAIFEKPMNTRFFH